MARGSVKKRTRGGSTAPLPGRPGEPGTPLEKSVGFRNEAFDREKRRFGEEAVGGFMFFHQEIGVSNDRGGGKVLHLILPRLILS